MRVTWQRPIEMRRLRASIAPDRQQSVLERKNGDTASVHGNVLIIAPPLVEGEREIDRFVEAIGGGLEALSASAVPHAARPHGCPGGAGQ